MTEFKVGQTVQFTESAQGLFRADPRPGRKKKVEHRDGGRIVEVIGDHILVEFGHTAKPQAYHKSHFEIVAEAHGN